MIHQHTIQETIRMQGIGLHSGKTVNLRVHPAPAGSGIAFVRADHPEAAPLPATVARVSGTAFATTLCGDEFCVSTIEHLLSALAGTGVDNALVELDADEVPIMDGSAAPFTEAILRAGLKQQKALRRHLVVTAPFQVSDGDRLAAFYPARDFRISYTIHYEHPVIRTQQLKLAVTPEKYAREIAPARTYGFLHEVQMLKANGFAAGGSLDNAVVVGQADVLNAEGLRFPDEFVRHKILDAVGDLYLLGMPLVGHFVGKKSGHTLHTRAARELLAHPRCWRVVEFDGEREREVVPAAAGIPAFAAAR